MTSPRERVLAGLAVVLIGITAFGVFYFLYYDRSLKSLDNRERNLLANIERDKARLEEIEKAMPGLKLARKMSLPADPVTARRLYTQELESMLAASRFPLARCTVTPKAESRSPLAAGAAAKKDKPPFTRQVVDIQASGDLSMLVDFLDRFYRTPLLHRIRSLSITKPETTTRGESLPGELNILISVEGLIVDGAENRSTLLPEGLSDAEKPKRLARTSAQYAAIAGNNVFYGPPPREREVEEDNTPRPDFDILPETWLTMIQHDEKGSMATIWDSANEYEYVIRRRLDGAYKIDKYYFLKGSRKRMEIGEEKLTLKDGNDYVHRVFQVVRVDAADVYLTDGEKLYRLHIGWRMNQIQPLTRDEARSLGLEVPGDKKGDKEAGKPENNQERRSPPTPAAEKPGEGRQ